MNNTDKKAEDKEIRDDKEIRLRGKTSSTVKRRYNSKSYDVVQFSVPKGEKELFQNFASSNQLSLTAFLRGAALGAIKATAPYKEGDTQNG